MNERIQQLAEKAGLTLSVDQQVAFQRAAELIVHECAHAVAQHNILSYQQSVPFNVSQVLKNHFGVKK